MPNTITGALPEQAEEINQAFATLRKDGYKATVNQGTSGEVSIVFHFGESEQTLKFDKGEWQKKDAIARKIIDRLNI